MIAAVAALVGVATPALPALAGDCGPVTYEPVPALAGGGLLYGVDVAADGTVMAAGRWDRPVGSGTDSWPRITRWTDGAWQAMSVPHPSPLPSGMQEASLHDVAVLSADDAWAVGTYRRPGADGFLGFQTLAMHFDGRGWELVPTPLTPSGTSGAEIRSVVALASDDVWACGIIVAGAPGPETTGLLMHWDGSDWTVLPAAPALDDRQVFDDLIVLPGGDVWCVGSYGPTVGYYPYAARYSGGTWTVYEGLPVPPGLNSLAAVAGTEDELWMVGRTVTTAGGQALVLRWNGSYFENQTPDELSLLSVRLEAVGVTPSGAVIAAGTGTTVPPPAVPRPLILRHGLDGWTEVPAGENGPSSEWYRGIAVTDECEAWIVGQRNPFDGTSQRISGGSGQPTPDIDGDGAVGLSDLVALLAAWGPCAGCPADLDGDGAVGIADLVTVLAAWT